MEERIFYPMSFYMDDRLEMVKQMFGTLKPKTIRNLAPEHVRDESMEVIEEFVLNELMCISNIRLRAIINDAHCPSDTESSDNSDSDRKAQHVSLEEISSDSDIDDPKKRKDSQISILELLELHARARAIRSQLAMEPVTKIEVDSDDNKEKVSTIVISRKSDDKTSSVSVTFSPPPEILAKEEDNVIANSANIGKTNKIHRSFRKKNHNKRTHSPDVISIVPEPVLLVIDSTDDEKATKTKKKIENNKITFEAEEGEILDDYGNKQMENQGISCSPKNNVEEPESSVQNETIHNINEGLKIKKEVTQDLSNDKESMEKVVSKADENEDIHREYETDTCKADALNNSDEDDVISLEGGDIDMIDLNEYTQSTFSSNLSHNMELGDIISIDSSNDDSNKGIFSWSDRYLKSTKVCKVLAASRLNKKVREKLKATKLSDKPQPNKAEDTTGQQSESINEIVNGKLITVNNGALSLSTKNYLNCKLTNAGANKKSISLQNVFFF